ncbi:glycosyltransferase [Thiorhodovibrio frisius]|uniref:Glycosyltransferase n=1 Tax=Thiorhodovibrio frisius TaxID=631362 RepID=H8Z4M7_9GAMM|nr:glycosyltransferase [Thiorhodovibrio frisius]EIC20284.1 glycosyltransferase [Thiorhodovibrio frisius]WPL21021.1 N-acetylgalactosamine-N,N'-diacetylbacillosaminyl-diphospho-undecaprenol 4-alpha-N-acetylgalactosaminyltransferase [Thiorhodovibrio frisius]
MPNENLLSPQPTGDSIGHRAPVALLGFRPGPGGIPRVMLDLIDGFQRWHVPVELLLPAGDYPDFTRLASGKPPCFPLSNGKPERAHQEIQSYLAQRQPAAILSNKERTSALLADLREQGVELPATWLRIGSDLREKIRRQRFWRRAGYRASLHRAYLAADGLIANSAGVAESIESLLSRTPAARKPPLRVIANPLNLTRVQALSKEPAPHPWLADAGAPVIIGMGRLVAVKDFQTLIRAFARLRQHRRARLILFGEGRQRSMLERLIRRLGLSEDIALPGFIANPFAALSRAALFVLSSRYEGSPNVLIEALACATPCVATDCRSGPRDILEQGRLGPLVPVGHVDALASAMARTLDAPLPADTLLHAARRFDLDTSVTAYLEALGLRPENADRPE